LTYIDFITDQSDSFQDIETKLLKNNHNNTSKINSNNINIAKNDSIEDKKIIKDEEIEISGGWNMRKESEDFESTEKLLQQFLERKQSNISDDGNIYFTTKKESAKLSKKTAKNIKAESNIVQGINQVANEFNDVVNDINDDDNDNDDVSNEINEDSNNIASLTQKINIASEKFINDKIRIAFFIMIKNQKFKISNTWSISDLIKELKDINYVHFDFYNGSPKLKINFEFIEKDKENINEVDNKFTNDYLLLFKAEENNKENIDEVLFNYFYNENIIFNPVLYSIHRASPFFYLLSLIELSVETFPQLFLNQCYINKESFENQKVSSLLTKQIRDPSAIFSNSIPKWCREVCHNFTFLASFSSRYLYFKICSFDIKRAMTNLYIYVKNYMGESIVDDSTITANKRKKFLINRDKIIESTDRLKNEFKDYNVSE